MLLIKSLFIYRKPKKMKNLEINDIEALKNSKPIENGIHDKQNG